VNLARHYRKPRQSGIASRYLQSNAWLISDPITGCLRHQVSEPKLQGELDIEQIGFVAYLDGLSGLGQIPCLNVSNLSNRCHKTSELGSSCYQFNSQQCLSSLVTVTTNRVMSLRLDPCVSHVKALSKFEVADRCHVLYCTTQRLHHIACVKALDCG